MKSWITITLFGGTSFIVAACAASPPGTSQAFKRGYLDGCESGYSLARPRLGYYRDDDRAAREPDYAEGWDFGLNECYNSPKARRSPER